MFRLKCPSCGHEIQGDAAQARRQVSCPQCGAQFGLPPKLPRAKPPAAPQPVAAPQPAAPPAAAAPRLEEPIDLPPAWSSAPVLPTPQQMMSPPPPVATPPGASRRRLLMEFGVLGGIACAALAGVIGAVAFMWSRLAPSPAPTPLAQRQTTPPSVPAPSPPVKSWPASPRPSTPTPSSPSPPTRTTPSPTRPPDSSVRPTSPVRTVTRLPAPPTPALPVSPQLNDPVWTDKAQVARWCIGQGYLASQMNPSTDPRALAALLPVQAKLGLEDEVNASVLYLRSTSLVKSTQGRLEFAEAAARAGDKATRDALVDAVLAELPKGNGFVSGYSLLGTLHNLHRIGAGDRGGPIVDLIVTTNQTRPASCPDSMALQALAMNAGEVKVKEFLARLPESMRQTRLTEATDARLRANDPTSADLLSSLMPPGAPRDRFRFKVLQSYVDLGDANRVDAWRRAEGVPLVAPHRANVELLRLRQTLGQTLSDTDADAFRQEAFAAEAYLPVMQQVISKGRLDEIEALLETKPDDTAKARVLAMIAVARFQKRDPDGSTRTLARISNYSNPPNTSAGEEIRVIRADVALATGGDVYAARLPRFVNVEGAELQPLCEFLGVLGVPGSERFGKTGFWHGQPKDRVFARMCMDITDRKFAWATSLALGNDVAMEFLRMLAENGEHRLAIDFAKGAAPTQRAGAFAAIAQGLVGPTPIQSFDGSTPTPQPANVQYKSLEQRARLDKRPRYERPEYLPVIVPQRVALPGSTVASVRKEVPPTAPAPPTIPAPGAATPEGYADDIDNWIKALDSDDKRVYTWGWTRIQLYPSAYPSKDRVIVKAAPKLAVIASTENHPLRLAAQQWLSSFPTQGRLSLIKPDEPALLEVLRDPRVDGRIRGSWFDAIVVAPGNWSNEIRGTLACAMIGDRDLHAQAATALQERGSPQQIRLPLVTAANPDPNHLQPRLEALFAGNDEALQSDVLDLLQARLDLIGASVATTVLPLFEHPHADIRVRAVRTIMTQFSADRAGTVKDNNELRALWTQALGKMVNDDDLLTRVMARATLEDLTGTATLATRGYSVQSGDPRIKGPANPIEILATARKPNQSDLTVQNVCSLLTTINDPDVADLLMAYLSQPSAGTRLSAAEALAKRRPWSGTIRAKLRAAQRAETNPRVRDKLADALEPISDAEAARLKSVNLKVGNAEMMLDTIANPRANLADRRYALSYLAQTRHPPDARTQALIVAALTDDSRWIRLAAMSYCEAMNPAGEDMTSVMFQLAEEDSWDTLRLKALQELARLAPNSPKVDDLLDRLTHDASGGVRRHAQLSCLRRGKVDALAVCIEDYWAYLSTLTPDLRQFELTKFGNVWSVAYAPLRLANPQVAREQLPQLEAGLKSPDPKVRRLALQYCVIVGPPARSLAPIIRDMPYQRDVQIQDVMRAIGN